MRLNFACDARYHRLVQQRQRYSYCLSIFSRERFAENNLLLCLDRKLSIQFVHFEGEHLPFNVFSEDGVH